jgi:hypothetical protein
MKKSRKSKATKSVRNLPAKALNAKTEKGVKGGFDAVEHGAGAGAGKVVLTPFSITKTTDWETPHLASASSALGRWDPGNPAVFKVILEPKKRRNWPKGYWTSWGRVPEDFDAPAALPSGHRPIDFDQPALFMNDSAAASIFVADIVYRLATKARSSLISGLASIA